MIKATDIAIIRDGRTLVDGASLELTPGRFCVIIGPNGAGKSTFLKVLSGELKPDKGTVTYADRDVTRMAPRDLAALRAVLPQSTALAFPFTALEVARMGAVAFGSLEPSIAARRALHRVDLAGFEGRSYHGLSGGEQQRVQFARVLAQLPEPVQGGIPRTLFLDEPTASLDIGHQIAVLDIARDFARGGGAVLAVLHDLNLAAEFADHLVIMHRGKIIAAGSPEDTLTDETVSNVYGIRGAVGRFPPPRMPFVLPQSRMVGASS
ncbi:heme ABC transporter ATP-binding protein [Rhizobium sp. RU36D]|uniref:heme ABC transporter ATP-binding protein n=1 Tax=Rhizobium sp. RU36D TaxID=1907415 RepID=UPI0009D8C926|nr:heme ABC transporter ATP-binding protein [Rhizobium sp. RU36D]SMC80215.1 iron complex transport system ATP-binding protein [Rhizobium sp. RU36D]